MEGEKAIKIQKYAEKNKLSFLRFDCRGHGKSFGKFEDFSIADWKKDLLEYKKSKSYSATCSFKKFIKNAISC